MPEPVYGARPPERSPRAEREEPSREELKQAISEQANQFAAGALLRLLSSLGFKEDGVELKGSATLGFRGSLVESVSFPEERACVLVNMGLLAAQTPLASSLHSAALSSPELQRFLSFFDQRLLWERFSGLHPEESGDLGPHYGAVRRDLTHLLGLAAPATLHWLFRRICPELGVQVERAPQKEKLAGDSVILGDMRLGEGASFGGEAELPSEGLLVTLYAEEPLSGTGEPWPPIIAGRLEGQLRPLLRRVEIALRVRLILPPPRPPLRIGPPPPVLGFAPLAGSTAPQAVEIFSYSPC